MLYYTIKMGGTQMKDKIILHIDANNFYASVECSLNPSLKNKAVAVSGNPLIRTGIILAKNQIAKKMGVKTGDAIWQAKEKCPELICLQPNMKLYEKYSQRLKEIYKKYTHLVEPFGIDECWLDITQTAHLFGGAENIANAIRQEVKDTLKITVSVGISFCKLFAKLGSDLKKPDAVTIIPKESFREIIYPLPITAIIGIGDRMEKKLNKLNVFTLGDLVEIPGYLLDQKFSVVFKEIRKKLLGFDNCPVSSSLVQTVPKSVGNGTTTIKDIFSENEIKCTVLFLCDKICGRLRKQNLLANSVGVTIKDCKLQCTHHSKVMPLSTNSSIDMLKFVMELVNDFWKYDEKIRAIRISAINLTTNQATQLSFFQVMQDKKNSLNSALDYLRNKYGKNIIQSANMLATPFLRESYFDKE